MHRRTPFKINHGVVRLPGDKYSGKPYILMYSYVFIITFTQSASPVLKRVIFITHRLRKVTHRVIHRVIQRWGRIRAGRHIDLFNEIMVQCDYRRPKGAILQKYTALHANGAC